MTHHSILQEILTQIRDLEAHGHKVLVIFDLDSTLFDVTERNRRILKEFAADQGMRARYPEETLIVAQAEFQGRDWGIRAPLERAGVKPKSVQFFTDVREFWRQRFFSNEYLHYDAPYDGAAEYVHELKNAGATVMYLTGRDEIRMGPGTREVLKKWNFPIEEDGCRVILKPHSGLDDAEFKKDIMIELADDFEEIWLFENEPVNLHVVAKHMPHVHLVYFESVHSGQAEPPEDIRKMTEYKKG
jgi:hypothetical protein